MIAIVDYGVGNIRAFENIYRRLGIAATAVRSAEDLRNADRIVLPGVGAFDWAMQLLNASGMRETLDEMVLKAGKPVIGVCVGMQMLGNRSDEGKLPGLGWIDADVVRFDDRDFNGPTHLPHMGWNDVRPVEGAALFRDIPDPRYYFLHSYYVRPAREENILARTHYGLDFASAIHAGHIYGMQFHPEKSHEWGISLLRNFAEI